jgi:hypothetical protein
MNISGQEDFAPMADSPSLPLPLVERLARLEQALDRLDRAVEHGSPAAAPGTAQQAALVELQGRVGRLVAQLEQALNGAAAAPRTPHAAD